MIVQKLPYELQFYSNHKFQIMLQARAQELEIAESSSVIDKLKLEVKPY
jgi:hypothetical protein